MRQHGLNSFIPSHGQVEGSCERKMNFRIPQNAVNFLNKGATNTFSQRTFLHGVSRRNTAKSNMWFIAKTFKTSDKTNFITFATNNKTCITSTLCL